jgi:phospholipid transport system substrate-binding protein
MKQAIDDVSTGRPWPAARSESTGATSAKNSRAEFSSLFGELIEKTYLAQVEGYSGEKIVYKSEKTGRHVRGVSMWSSSRCATPIFRSPTVVLNKNASWFVYDVVIEGVSLVNNYRSQIGSVLDTSSYSD